MKKINTAKDKSGAYRTFGLGKIEAPSKVKDAPRAQKNTGKGDLRGGRANG